MLSLDVWLTRVLDLTDPAVRSPLNTSNAELCSPRIPGAPHPSLAVGTAAAALGMDGIIAPSAVHSGKNLIIYPDAHLVPPYTIVRSIKDRRA